MTRLSEALKRAAAADDIPVRRNDLASGWQFPTEEASVTVAAPLPGIESSAPAAAVDLAMRFHSEERSRLVVSADADPSLVEQYRHLAAVLHHAQSESGCRSVMITSALPSEGKTLTATNLALTLSESYQRRVLLIDADLRRPRIHQVFGLPIGDGLTNSLSGRDGRKLPLHQITPTLWVLTAGIAPVDPMSTLVSESMKRLLDEARQMFDWVLVDTPPIAILPDANLLASMIDTALLVVSAQATPFPMVQRAADAIGRSRILGVVLNRAEASASSGYGYYSRSAPAPEPASRWPRWLRKSPRVQ